jgi:amino acid adenylation domain-containing protein
MFHRPWRLVPVAAKLAAHSILSFFLNVVAMQTRPFREHILDLPEHWESRIAFASTARDLTFAELRQALLGCAGWLMNGAGIAVEQRVAVCVPKTLEAAILIHALFAVGAVYVPLEYQSPADRLAVMLDVARPHLLITTAAMARQLRAHCIGEFPRVETYEAMPDGSGLEALIGATPRANDLPQAQPQALAAIIFTSGSTGEPKGVMLSQRICDDTWDWVMRRAAVNETDRRVSHAKLRFLPTDLFFGILTGCRAYLLTDREALFPEFIIQTCERERITLWNSTPTSLRLLIEAIGSRQADFSSLRHASFYGEMLPVTVVRKAMALMPNTEFANSYGATEASGMTIYRVPRPIPDDLLSFPVGHPARGFTVSICNESGNALPAGEVGEIAAVGPSVMMGYWNDPELTARKRLPGNPNSYRTGDLGYLDEAGMLHLVGRRDQMVKLRGQRLDLGEVEATLKSHPAVREAVAFAVDVGAEKEIRAAVLSDAGDKTVSELRVLCQRRLPTYGRPARIDRFEDFPLLATGKIDRKKIQAMATAAGEEGAVV